MKQNFFAKIKYRLWCVLSVFCILIACHGTPRPVSVTITPIYAEISKGTDQQYKAIVNYENGSIADVTSSVQWHTSDASIATIKSTGLATGISRGTTSISARFGKIESNKATLKVVHTFAYIANNAFLTPTGITVSNGIAFIANLGSRTISSYAVPKLNQPVLLPLNS